MPETINYGIDLGTTNSAIGHFVNGEIEIFNNPITLKQTIPSVVSYKGDKIIVGDKAKEQIKRNPLNTFGSFKRKMGTSELYNVPSLGKSVSPIELSSLILKELRNFIHTGDTPGSVVITVPAAFDTVQSNATKQAGYDAGFDEIILLQEPIAASLAFANGTDFKINDGKWLVYDFGGGTFDISLIESTDSELRVKDHEGDNYLGGRDIDIAIIDTIIIPELKKHFDYSDIESELKNSDGNLYKLYNKLLYYTEEAKKELTIQSSTDIEFTIINQKGEEEEVLIEINKNDFNQSIIHVIQKTADLTNILLDRNNLLSDDLQCILLVGGTTYVPLVKQFLQTQYNTDINSTINPITAVVSGACYFAGTKLSQSNRSAIDPTHETINVQLAYERQTRDKHALILINPIGPIPSDANYRITRTDGGFDSNIVSIETSKSITVSLLPKAHNNFLFVLTDNIGNKLYSEEINITQGHYIIDGQTLPNDISLEVDAMDESTTFLEPIFKKNSILPLKKVITKKASKTIQKGSPDSVIINVLEGQTDTLPAANKSLGIISIAGDMLDRDLIQGTDIDIEFSISESRDLSVEVYLSLTDQTFQNTFTANTSSVDIGHLKIEINQLVAVLGNKLTTLESNENYEQASHVNAIRESLIALRIALKEFKPGDTTDRKFQLARDKRRLAKEVHKLINSSYLTKTIQSYLKQKEYTENKLNSEFAISKDHEDYDRIISNEKLFLKEGNPNIINVKIKSLNSLIDRIYDRRPKEPPNLRVIFLLMRLNTFTDPEKAERLIEKGKKALEKNDESKVIAVINSLYKIIKDEKDNGNSQKTTGLH